MVEIVEESVRILPDGRMTTINAANYLGLIEKTLVLYSQKFFEESSFRTLVTEGSFLCD